MNFGGFGSAGSRFSMSRPAQANYGAEFVMPPDEIFPGPLVLTDRGIALTFFSQPTNAAKLDPFPGRKCDMRLTHFSQIPALH
jgi:hypothetical protein